MLPQSCSVTLGTCSLIVSLSKLVARMIQVVLSACGSVGLSLSSQKHLAQYATSETLLLNNSLFKVKYNAVIHYSNTELRNERPLMTLVV